MTVISVVAIFVVGFLILYAAYKYGGQHPLVQYAVYVIVVLIFIVVLCQLAGILPNHYLNKRI